jgi:drug/metabolite transporter (DMT)-like permease
MTVPGPAAAAQPHPPARRWRGALLIAAAAVCWGSSATLGRAVFTGHLLPARPVIDPLILAQSRVTLSALLLVPGLLALRGRGSLRLPIREATGAMLLGALGIAVSNYGYYLAIQKTNVATAIVLQYTAPIWVLGYMVARGRQRATLPRLIGVAAAFCGILLAIGAAAGGMRLNPVGVIAALAAAFSFAFYNVDAATLLRRIDATVLTTWALIGAVLFWAAIHPPWKIVAAHYTGADWLFLWIFALLSMLVPTLLYFSGLRWLDATSAIVTSCLEPVSGILLATLFLGEPLDWTRALGVALVLCAIVLIQRPEKVRTEVTGGE